MIQLYPILRLRIKTMRILWKLSSFLLSCIPFGENFDEAVDLANGVEMTVESYYKTSIEFYDTALSYFKA